MDPPASMSRSRTSQRDVQSMADAMLSISLSKASSPSSAAPSERSRTASLSASTLCGDRIIEAAKHEPATKSTKSSSTTSATASSRTRERLRQAELERDELRRVMMKERAEASEMRRLAERLKREGHSAAGLSSSDKTARMRELEREAKAARAGRRPPSKDIFKKACSTDLLFLMDTTGSMYSYIDAAKKQVLEIVRDIKEAFLNEADVRIAVVSYKDHGDTGNCDFIDFTTSPDEVRNFISTLSASGGGDAPEDVLGGMNRALNLSWKQQTRCIIHIADAPPHGHTLHDLGASEDTYPEPGHEPHGLHYEPLVTKLITLNINYALLRIQDQTDRMALKFFEIYAAAGADCTLLEVNTYHEEALSLMQGDATSSRNTAKGGLLFVEMELGTTYSALRRLVVSTVTSSASQTAIRVSSAQSSSGFNRPQRTKLSILSEEQDPEEVELDTSEPQWDTAGWLDEKLIVEGFSPNIEYYGAGTLDAMMAADENITMSVSELTISKRSRPFSQGAMRMAYHARTAASANCYVVKSFKRSGKSLAHLVEDMQAQALCKAFALEFNALAEEDQAIDFIATTCFKGRSVQDGDSADNCLSLEPFLEGDYVKYQNNTGWVNKKLAGNRFNQAAQAFSHFTFERSRGDLLVCDLQGIGCLLTDPAIHTRDPERFKLIDANMGESGFKFFFSTHTCNDICEKLELQSNKTMLAEGGALSFRMDWPLMDRTTCCSNKLCGRIIHIYSAMRSDEFSGFLWCTMCWPQLTLFKRRWMCIAGDADHEFDVSTFFYESQGRRAPRTCPHHRDPSESVDHRGRVYRLPGWSAPALAPTPASHASLPPVLREDHGSRGMLGSHAAPSTNGASRSARYSLPAVPESRIYSEPPTYATTASSPPLPMAVGTVATVRNSTSLWSKLKSATKIKKMPSRNKISL